MSSNPGLTIRIFSTSDIDQAISIAEKIGLSPWSREGFLHHLKTASNVSLALITTEKQLVGFLVARPVPGGDDCPDAELLNLGVDASFRKFGGGSLLMGHFLTWCAEQGVERVWLEVRESNQAAQSFYEQFSFFRIDRRKNFYSLPTEDALIMCRERED